MTYHIYREMGYGRYYVGQADTYDAAAETAKYVSAQPDCVAAIVRWGPTSGATYRGGQFYRYF